MRIYLMRHGIAVDRAATDPAMDAARTLTAEGAERTRSALHGLVRLGVGIDRIVSSPLVRATQTADLAGEALGVPRLAISVHPALAPDGDVLALASELWSTPHVEAMLCIGHAPGLDLLLAALVDLERPVTALKKAAVAVVERRRRDEPTRLVAVYEPKALRLLGRS